MVALQHEGRRIRDAKTILVKRSVGKSECNGRVENTIRRVHDKARTLKCHIEAETLLDIDKIADLMSYV